MKKTVFAALAAASLLAGATAANADTHTFNLVTPAPAPDGSISVNYGDADPTVGNADFTDTFNFILPAGLTSATISSTMTAATNNVDFTSVTLNGFAFTPVSTGTFEIRTFPASYFNAGTNTIVVTGHSGVAGGYDGVISFSPGVPEPATWALMILGLGAVGVAMRRNRRQMGALTVA